MAHDLSVELLEVSLGPRARGFFTTRGTGAPPVTGHEPYAGTNLALHVGDDEARVLAHRQALGAALAREVDGREPVVAWMNQVHSALVAPARTGTGPHDVPTADALLLDTRPGTGERAPGADRDGARPDAAAVLVADCVPLLLSSGDGRLCAAVHAGRRGLLDGVVTAAVRALEAAGAQTEDLWAAVGPSVCGRCYEVPEEMREAGGAVEPACAATTRWGTPGLDVAAGVLAQLERLGVGHVEHLAACTLEEERLYSYRRDGRTGRLAGVVVAHRD